MFQTRNSLEHNEMVSFSNSQHSLYYVPTAMCHRKKKHAATTKLIFYQDEYFCTVWPPSLPTVKVPPVTSVPRAQRHPLLCLIILLRNCVPERQSKVDKWEQFITWTLAMSGYRSGNWLLLKSNALPLTSCVGVPNLRENAENRHRHYFSLVAIY